MTVTNAATDNTSNDGTTLTTPDKIQIIANRHEDVTIVASAKVISYATTDTTFGYKIFMSMAGDNANLYLDGNTDSEYYFAPTTKLGLSTNSWGYSLDGEEEYYAMPGLENALMAQQNTEAATDDEFTVYYTMKADKDMPYGVYSGEIAYDIEGYNGFPDTLTTMQGMTSEICDAVYTPNAFRADGVTIEDNVPTATLTDIRDNKTYTIAKLADGKCWMTQNLDLQKEDLLAGVTLDNTNTDNPADGFELPDSQTSGYDSWINYDEYLESVNTAHIYDPASKSVGNYYNWYSATAGTSPWSLSEGLIATGSICPKGWRLPNNSSTGSPTDYSVLLHDYGILTSIDSSGSYVRDNVQSLFNSPLSFLKTGSYRQGIVDDKSFALWSFISQERGTAATALYASGTDVYLWIGRGRQDGISMRCVAR